jgi:hypothetical protein
LDLPELVAQLQIREQLVVTLEQQVQVQQVQVQQVQVQQVQLVQLVLVQLVQELLLAVAPLELVEHPCLPKNFGAQKMLVLKNLPQPVNQAYLF